MIPDRQPSEYARAASMSTRMGMDVSYLLTSYEMATLAQGGRRREP